MSEHSIASAERPVVFMFPGQGAQYVNMGRALYEQNEVFRRHIDIAASALKPVLDVDIRAILYPNPAAEKDAADRLRQTAVTQPVLFAVEHALAMVWLDWGVRPSAMIGHSVGEYTAACLAGVFSFEDTIVVLAERARLMQAQPPGGMLAVRSPASDIVERLREPLALAAVNAPALSVVSGPADALEILRRELEETGIRTTTLHTSHAYHSSMMDPVMEPFIQTVSRVARNAPRIPFISSLTGTWVTTEQATDPMYWARQLRSTVRFSDGIRELLGTSGQLFLEVGPGTTLTTFAVQHVDTRTARSIIPSLGHPQSNESAVASLGAAAARLHEAGAALDWERVRLATTNAKNGGHDPMGVRQEGISMTSPNHTLHRLIGAQLAIMRRQLEALRGANLRTSDSPTAAQDVARDTKGPRPAAIKQDRAPVTPNRVSDAADTEAKPFGAAARIQTRSSHELSAEQKQWLDAFTARYVGKTAKSREYTERHRASLADPRVVSGFTPLFKELVYPIVAERAEGSRLWDLDGNEYLDMINGFGSNFLGYSSPVVVEALMRRLGVGYAIGPQHPLAGEVAGLISEMTGLPRVAFCNTGSEAVLGAIRAARTVTGRSTIVMFRNSYHGINDEVIVRGAKGRRSMPAASGIPRSAVESVMVLDYGDDESLDIIREHADSIAAVLVEPVQGRHLELQPREFLHRLREITAEANTALIIDEIITGFRVGLGGAQEYFGVRADIATYGKVVGGGLPIGVIAGVPRFMDALDGGRWRFGDDSVPEVGVTYFAGTFVRHPLALTAAHAVLTHLRESGGALHQRMNELAADTVHRLRAVCSELGAPVRIEHFSSVFQVVFTVESPNTSLFYPMLRERGVHMYDGRGWFITAAHTRADMDFLVDTFRAALEELLNNGFLPREAAGASQATVHTPGPATNMLPPTPDARLGRDPNGQPAWFRPDPDRPGKYLKVGS